MSNEKIQGAIDVLIEQITVKTAELNNNKRTVNDLCKVAGLPPAYSDADLQTKDASGSIRPDQFYGKSPITAAREFLETRDKRAASLEEILNALIAGGFDFDAQGWTDTMRLKNLGISISKNTLIFHRLPNNKMIGLTKWYPDLIKKKAGSKDADKAETEVEEVETEELNEAEASETEDIKEQE